MSALRRATRRQQNQNIEIATQLRPIQYILRPTHQTTYIRIFTTSLTDTLRHILNSVNIFTLSIHRNNCHILKLFDFICNYF
jgi:hypothetical protein